MLNILLVIIFIIIIFIIILLYIGITIALVYDKKGPKLEGCLKILILKRIKVYSIDFPSENEDREEDDDEESEEHNVREIIDLAKPCFEDIKEFLHAFAGCIHVEKLENNLIFGLDSYVDTAKYIGYIWSLLIIINSTHEKARLSAQPSFNGCVFDASGDNRLEINLLKLIVPAVKLFSKKEVRMLIGGVRNG